MRLCDFSTESLLYELIRRNGQQEAPTKEERFTRHYSTLVSVDKDHTAEIVLDRDAFERLKDIAVPF